MEVASASQGTGQLPSQPPLPPGNNGGQEEHEASSSSAAEISSTDGGSGAASTSSSAAAAVAAVEALNLGGGGGVSNSPGSGEPIAKKARVDGGTSSSSSSSSGTGVVAVGVKLPEKLEQRLGGILCCAVCLDLPKAAVYQCSNGHLMCAGCFTHVLADARLREETAHCPNCRVDISKATATRNLAVEKAVSELPAECQHCNKEFPRNSLEHHEREKCEERTSACKFKRIGCPWRGPYHELESHQGNCCHPKKTGLEIMDVLNVYDEDAEKERKFWNSMLDLLNFERIYINDTQLKPYRTDEFVHKLYYETSRFTAGNHQWVVKAKINSTQRDPTHSCERQLAYQLILKTKPTSSTHLDVNFVLLKGPFGDMKVAPAINHFIFSDQNTESPYFPLKIPDNSEVNRLLSQKAVNFRIVTCIQ